MKPLQRAVDFVFGPVAAGRLVVFRALFAATLLYYVAFRWRFAAEWLTPVGYHPSGGASVGFQQAVPLLPEAALPWFGVAYFAAIVALILGFKPRLAIWPVLLGTAYVTGADRLAAFTINKIFLGGLLILALAPPIVEDAAGRPTIRSAWPLRALQFTLIVQLFGAGICKVRYGDWLAHGDTLWHQVQVNFMTDTAAWMVRNVSLPIWAGLQHLALAFELAAPLLFMVRRLRPLGYAMGFGMFLTIALTMRELMFFALQMCAFFVLFVDEARLHRWRRALSRDGDKS
ncbi:hypothetical protein [Nannocystis bainbridge]|uniref:HTTM domain-containing protein n=1 Tax=Nannocystis bainbridge TaxID=2995303 RepID=A0ABT5DXS1_9BACT|nr:hypothetical protein [Nannocystis bainbridge]MDC0718407.1 hypothetical protein [Nannocystis bainbridge]